MKTLKEKFASKTPIIGGWASIGSSLSAEILGVSGFDCVTVDTQHGLTTDADVMQMLQAISATPAIPMARSRWNDPASIMRLLDMGAMGIICPMTNTQDDALDFVKACCYAPKGYRSFGPIRAAVTYPSYFQNANDCIVKLAMVETQQAYENLESILSIEELDGIFVGPNDLGVSFGYGAILDQDHQEFDELVQNIAATAHRFGKFTGIFCGGSNGAKKRIIQGYQYVVLGNDNIYLKQASQQAISSIQKLLA